MIFIQGIITEHFDIMKTESYLSLQILNVSMFISDYWWYICKDHKIQLVLLLCEPGNSTKYGIEVPLGCHLTGMCWFFRIVGWCCVGLDSPCFKLNFSLNLTWCLSFWIQYPWQYQSADLYFSNDGWCEFLCYSAACSWGVVFDRLLKFLGCVSA